MAETKQSDIQNSQLAEVELQIKKYQTSLEELKAVSSKLDEELNAESSKLQIEVKKFESEINHMKEDIE